MPRDSTTLLVTARMTRVVIMVRATRVTPKLEEYDPLLLEVKWGAYLPDVIRDAVQLPGRRTEAFSTPKLEEYMTPEKVFL